MVCFAVNFSRIKYTLAQRSDPAVTDELELQKKCGVA